MWVRPGLMLKTFADARVASRGRRERSFIATDTMSSGERRRNSDAIDFAYAAQPVD